MLATIIFLPLSLSMLLLEKPIRLFFNNHVYENDLNNYLNYKKIDFNNFQNDRYSKFNKYVILLILLPILKFNIYYLILVLILMVYAYKLPYYQIKKEYNQTLKLVRYQFPIWLRQIQILLYNNNVLNSLKYSLSFTPNLFKNDLEKLIMQLELNPNDLTIFTSFLSQYNISEINRAMKLLYRTYIVDKENSTDQLNRMIVATTKWIRVERKDKQKDSISYFEWIGIIPLIGVTIVFLAIMANLILNLFEMGVR